MTSSEESRSKNWLAKAPYFSEKSQDKPMHAEFIRPAKPATPRLNPRRPEAKSEDHAGARPRCIKSYRSDRMAIYDEQRDSFHAYSVTEAISQPGLSFQEAVDWVDERLVLVGNRMNPTNFSVAIGLIAASWFVAILLLMAIARVIF